MRASVVLFEHDFCLAYACNKYRVCVCVCVCVYVHVVSEWAKGWKNEDTSTDDWQMSISSRGSLIHHQHCICSACTSYEYKVHDFHVKPTWLWDKINTTKYILFLMCFHKHMKGTVNPQISTGICHPH